MSRPKTNQLPPVGTVLVDTARDRFGEFRAVTEGVIGYWLRPVGGGREWTASPDRLREATPAEQRIARQHVDERLRAYGRESA